MGSQTTQLLEAKVQKDSKGALDNDDSDYAMVMMLETKDPREELALTAWHATYVDSCATASRVKKNSMLSKENFSNNC